MTSFKRAPQRPCFVGLDCETTGSVVSVHKLIQIGVCLDDGSLFSARVSWQEFEFDQAALDAIGRSPSDIILGPTAEQVDDSLVEWCRLHNVYERGVVPVGWAVSNFDMPFVEVTFPRFFTTYLTHRSVELNAVCYSIAGAKSYIDEMRTFEEWKAMSKEAAEDVALRQFDVPCARHDAGYDALTSILAWQWLRKIIEDPWPATANLEMVRIREQALRTVTAPCWP